MKAAAENIIAMTVIMKSFDFIMLFMFWRSASDALFSASSFVISGELPRIFPPRERVISPTSVPRLTGAVSDSP